jgi:hypothetical protein
MGLIEKRLIKQGTEEWVPEAQTELREVTGSEQVYAVEWNTFETDEAALNNVRNQGLRRITAAFRVVCADSLGQEAVKEQVQKVVVRNTDTPAKKGMSLKDGTFTLVAAYGKGDTGYYSDNEIIAWLQRAL